LDENLLMSRGVAADELDGALGAAEGFGQQEQQGLVGGGIDWRGGDPDLEFVADGLSDFIAGGARLEFDGELHPIRLDTEEAGEWGLGVGGFFGHGATRELIKIMGAK
jgi:hypothetical protein